ncbi:MAG: hypothetical protein EOP45_13330 [Sphingobacteriaceae bacterium]|nr:MAG: hypothetical protein EOP45_13330 [Sphingobacteriaceae bacterium]
MTEDLIHKGRVFTLRLEEAEKTKIEYIKRNQDLEDRIKTLKEEHLILETKYNEQMETTKKQISSFKTTPDKQKKRALRSSLPRKCVVLPKNVTSPIKKAQIKRPIPSSKAMTGGYRKRNVHQVTKIFVVCLYVCIDDIQMIHS